MSTSTRGKSPDMVILPCGCQAGSYCTGPCAETNCDSAPVQPLRSIAGHARNQNAAVDHPNVPALGQKGADGVAHRLHPKRVGDLDKLETVIGSRIGASPQASGNYFS